MTAEPQRPHKPSLFSDLTQRIDAAGGVSPEHRSERAASTALALIEAGRADPAQDPATFVELADRLGLDTLGELWNDADPAGPAGALWALYLLRQWTRTAPEEVVRLWRGGEPLAAADAVVAGVGTYADATAVQAVTDAVLVGVFRGDVAVAFERAAALLRVLAVGRRATVVGDRAGSGTQLADHNERAAKGLAAAAAAWRAGRFD